MDNNLLFILLLVLMGKSPDNSSSRIGSTSSFTETMKLDNKYTLEKIKIARKIGPYFPENYIPLLNKSISLVENLIKINEVKNSMTIEDQDYILEHIPMNNKKDRLNKVISIIQKELPDSKFNKSGTIFDLILNMEKYQKTFEILNTVMSSGVNINDPSQLINLMGPLLGGDPKDKSAKFKEMSQMMEMMKLLDTPKKKPV